MIKGVLLDYGGVVAHGGRGIEIARRLCREVLGLPESDAEQLMPLFGEFTKGNIDETTFWEKIELQTGLSITESQRHAWDDWWSLQPFPEMLEMIDRLRAAGYQVGLLSNIILPTKDKIKAGGGYDSFDFTVLSCDVGFAKPDPEMYDLAVVHFDGLTPEEIVFVDDQEKCLPPAEALGIKTILGTSTEQILEELRKLNLPV